MKRKTLLGQLVGVHVSVVAASCVLLAGGAMVAGAYLLGRNQDDDLMQVAGSLCHDIVMQRSERAWKASEAAAEAFAEADLPGYRVELVSPDGTVLLAAGRPFELPDGTPLAADACVAFAATDAVPAVRACARSCAGAESVRVLAEDVLHHPETRLALFGLVAALPLAVLAGGLIGWSFFRERLRPLGLLRDAAARLEPGPDIRLDVRTTASELEDLERAFNQLLARLSEMLHRERRFSQEASHELRTPLTALRGRLEELDRQLAARPEARALVATTLEELASLDRLIDGLLLLARSESAPFLAAPVNLCDVARDVAHRQSRADGPRMPPPEVVGPDEILVRGSEDLLVRALGNLVENARKYGGPTARIRMRLEEEDGRGVVSVEDDGPGILDELRPFVFESFVRGPADRNRVPGSGLGLAVVRAIVRRHGGDVSTGRAALGGEAIRIVLPLLERRRDNPAL